MQLFLPGFVGVKLHVPFSPRPHYLAGRAPDRVAAAFVHVVVYLLRKGIGRPFGYVMPQFAEELQ